MLAGEISNAFLNTPIMVRYVTLRTNGALSGSTVVIGLQRSRDC